MTTNPDTITLHVTRDFPATAERVFDAWLDPTTAGTWLFSTEAGQMVRVDIDNRVGGSFLFTDRRDGVDVEHVGTYREIERPRRLVFDFAVPMYSPATTRVSVDILPSDAGCTLTLRHEPVPRDNADQSERGWTTILARLAGTLAA